MKKVVAKRLLSTVTPRSKSRRYSLPWPTMKTRAEDDGDDEPARGTRRVPLRRGSLSDS